MQTVDFRSHLPIWLRRILPLLVGLVLLWLFMVSVAAGTAAKELEPEALGSISGTVTNAAGQPISGIEVVAYRSGGYFWLPARGAQTDEAGAYLLPALTTGIYRLHFRDPQGNHAQEYYDKAPALDGATDITIAGDHVTGIDARLDPPAQISGTVTIADGVAPNIGWLFLYSPSSAEWQIVTKTEMITPTGDYHFGELIAGTYRVCGSGWFGVESQDFFSGCYGGATVENALNIQVTTGETVADIDFSLGEGQFDGMITGAVTSDGTPIAGIKVSLYDGAIPPPELQSLPLVYTYTNAAGAYRLGGLHDGFYLVSFADPAGDYVTRYYRGQRRPEQAESIPLRGGATVRNINADLPQAGAISGHIRFTDARPAASTEVNLHWFSGEQWELQTVVVPLDAAENYIIKGLEPGTYRICFPFTLEFGFPFYFPNCRGTDRFSALDYQNAAPIFVAGGMTVTGIDATIGPAVLYTPGIHSQ